MLEGLRKLIEMARRRQIDAVITTCKDRLTRFGYKYLEELFRAYGARIITVFRDEPRDYYQELIEDLMAIVTSFAGRIYGKRSHKYTGFKYPSSNGSPMALGSTEPHEVWAKRVNPLQGLTPLIETNITKLEIIRAGNARCKLWV